MKGLFCAQCACLRTLANGNFKPVSCDCGNVYGWWLDGQKGVARYTANAPAYAWGVGLNSSVIVGVISQYGENRSTDEWRDLLNAGTDAPGYLFDKSMHDSWVIFFRPNKGGDVNWATDEDRRRVGLTPYPEGHALKEKT